MGENKEYVTRSETNGMINISEDVIATIACAAVLDTDGVAGLVAPTGKDFSELLGKKGNSKGVKIAIDGNDVAVETSISVKYGYMINNVARDVQDSVSSAIESTTGLTVTQVNVSISAVSFEKVK